MSIARPNRDNEPTRPPMGAAKQKFWDLFQLESLDTRDDKLRKAAMARLVELVDLLLALLARWRDWGRWADARVDLGIDASEKLFLLASGLRNKLIGAESALEGLAREEKNLEARLVEEVKLWDEVFGLKETVREQIDAVEKEGKLEGERLNAFLEAVTGLSDSQATLNKFSEAAKLASERLRCREELADAKDNVLEEKWATYHLAMIAAASEMPNPKYIAEFGWSKDGKFVPNPQHPFWMGQNFARYLQKTNALDLDGPFRDAHKRKPGEGGISLEHPLSVIDDRSCFAGIRHRLERTRANYDDMSWTPLPDALKDWLDVDWS